MNSGKMYIYHLEEGKMVVDVADHLDHWRQARAAMSLKPTRVVAATFVPLEDRYIPKYEELHGVKFESRERKKIPEFIEPEHWTRFREKLEKAKAKREGVK